MFTMPDKPIKPDIFRALADPQRRELLDRLFEKDGLTLTELCGEAAMSRQAVSKHLGILESADVITTRMVGRHKYHYLNPVPIQEIANRWLNKFSQHQASVLINLRNELEDNNE
jgi:DNA-binding transcriptional ArsR family regulator